MLNKLKRIFTAALLVMAYSTLSHAATDDSLNRILNQKKIVIGVINQWPPFGSIDAQGQPVGYEADVAKLAGQYLGVEVELVPVAFPNAIPFLLTNKIDAIFAMLGVTPERAKQIAYSEPYAENDLSVLAAKKTSITKPEDLKGLRVGVARGTSAEKATLAILPEDVQIKRFDIDADTIQAFISGQTDTISTSSLLLPIINKANPSLEAETKLVLRNQYHSIGVRREDRDLLRWLNTFLFYVKSNGELNTIHETWLHKPLPELPVLN